jgi:arylsulfatase A-like enzyme
MAISLADSLIKEIVNAVNNYKNRDDYIILITSDHGFKGKNHGGRSRKAKMIPWLIIGSEIQKGKRIKSRVRTYDTASTIASLYSLKIPVQWKGKPIKGILIEK